MRVFSGALTSAIVLSIYGLSALASERYPTAQELQQLTQQFQQRLPTLQNDQTGFYQDRRTTQEQQQINAFVSAWSKVDPGVAPFLGQWVAIEETMSIYPSRTPGKVCIIETFIPELESSGLSFSMGEVTNGTIRTSDRNILIRQGAFLGSIFVYEQKAGLYEYGHPRPLGHPEQVPYFQKDPKIVQQFQQAGCKAGLPNASK